MQIGVSEGGFLGSVRVRVSLSISSRDLKNILEIVEFLSEIIKDLMLCYNI